MLASLPMYDFPELRAATDAWWRAIARALHRQGVRDAPWTLTRHGAREIAWRDEALLLTQTCGYPLMHEFAGSLKALAVPVYNAPGCTDGFYNSAIIARDDNSLNGIEAFRGRRLAANAPDSQSGCNCLRSLIAPLAPGGRFFSDIIWTGAHRRSLAAVRNNHADIAAIDTVTLALMKLHAADELNGLRILCRSESVPALPYATRTSASPDLVQRLRNSLQQAVEDPRAKTVRETLLIDGFKAIDDDAYLALVGMREKAWSFGYRELDKISKLTQGGDA